MKNVVKIFMWIIVFPFMLTFWGWNNKKKSVMVIGGMLSALYLAIGMISQSSSDSNIIDDNLAIEQTIEKVEEVSAAEDIHVSSEITSGENTMELSRPEAETVAEESDKTKLFDGYTLIEVDGGDLSGKRQAKVVVNIGFGDREYYAFTNEYGQLIRVIAKEIILQDDSIEPVTAEGRYYPDEAKVPGTEAKDLDEGHVIADSLGGVSNAYNITPQNSTLNRHGDQAYMERIIRDAGGCTNFEAIIMYPDTKTQIPKHYIFTYTLKGNVIKDEFDNVDPDEVNSKMNDNSSSEEVIVVENSTKNEVVSPTGGIAKIIELDKKAEYIVIKNISGKTAIMTGWKLVSVKGNQIFIFPEFSLEPNETVKVGDSGVNVDVDFHWLDGRGTWNNSDSDPAELYNDIGEMLDRYND